MECQKLNQLVDPSTVIVSDMVSLLDSFNTWYGANDSFQSQSKKERPKQFQVLISHLPAMNSSTIAFLPKGYGNPPFCLNISQRNMDHFDISTGHHPVHWTDSIMLIRSHEWKYSVALKEASVPV